MYNKVIHAVYLGLIFSLGDLVDLMINSKAKTDPALMKKDSIQFYPNNTDWIVKLTGIMTTDIDEEHISITADTHFLKLSNISEELLIDKFNNLSAQKGCEYKHYLIYMYIY